MLTMTENITTQNVETYDDEGPCRSLSTSVVPFALTMQEVDDDIQN